MRRDASPGSAKKRCGALLLALVGITPAHAAVESRFIDPVDTGPGVRPLDELPGSGLRDLRHFVALDEEVAVGNRLLLFMPGSGGLPENQQAFSEFAATRGYHVVNLAYPNWPSVRDLTKDLGDLALAEAVRRERLYGEAATDLIDIDEPNSIQGRLTRLLDHLHAENPAQGWDAFTEGTAPRWDRIAVAGHSQGAGYAAYLMKETLVAGSIMFAGPGDFVSGLGTANWHDRPNLTPAERAYWFTHREDPDFLAFNITANLLGLDDLGPIQDIDGLDPDAITSHRLTSTLEPALPGEYHGAVVVDDKLPLDDSGTPLYQPAWAYMLDALVPEPGTGAVWLLHTMLLMRRGVRGCGRAG